MTFPFDEENRKRKASAFTLKRNEYNEEARRNEAAENPDDGMDVDSDDVLTEDDSVNSADMARMARFQILGEAGLGGMEIDDDEDEDYVMVDDEGVSPEDMELVGQLAILQR